MNSHMALCFFIMFFFNQCIPVNNTKPKQNYFDDFGIVYSKIEPEQVKDYGLVIIESALYSEEEIMAMKMYGTKVLGYLSLGEVNEYRSYFPLLRKNDLLGTNTEWNSFYLDISDDSIRGILLNAATDIIDKQLDGLFLDTIDAVSPGSSRAHLIPNMIQLIKALRDSNPNKIIVQNAGLFLLEETQSLIDAVTVESIVGSYDFEEKEYKIYTDRELESRLEWLDSFRKKSKIPFLVMDFADTDDRREKIKNVLDTLGMPYFISNIELDVLPSKIPVKKGES